MKMKPIIFSTPMVQAILEGKKTMTRRVIKKKYNNTDLEIRTDKYGTRLIERQNDAPADVKAIGENGEIITTRHLVAIADVEPPYRRGDILWVRETWAEANGIIDPSKENPKEHFIYKAGFMLYKNAKWRSPRFMPRKAARLFLRVTDVRAERLQDISEEDAKAEGVTAINDSGCGYRGAFRELWNALNAKRGFDWYTNSWVWVIRFERLDTLALAARAGAEPVYQQLLRSAT